MRLSIRSFPLVIEPSVAAIEVQLQSTPGENASERGGTQVKWTALHRLCTAELHRLPGIPLTARHCFGEHADVQNCRFFVSYDAAGLLTHLVFIGQDNTIEVEDLPDEFLGRATELPSVRLVFRDTTDRDRYLGTLPAHVLDVLAEPPRCVGVGVVNHGPKQ